MTADIDKRFHEKAHKMVENRQTDQYNDYLSVEQINFIIRCENNPSALFVLLSVCCLAARGSRALAIDSSTPRAENEADWPADAINLFCGCGKRKKTRKAAVLKVKSGSAYYTQL